MANLKKGDFLFIGSIQEVFEVVDSSEKAILVSRNSNRKKTWLPISGLQKQERHPLFHVSTPDTYKIKHWVKTCL